MRAARLVLAAWLSFAAVTVSARAEAYCRSTTCSDNCPTDDNGCKTTGFPLLWTTSCVGVSLQQNGTDQLPYATVTQVVNSCLATWTSVACADGTRAAFAYARFHDATCTIAEYTDGGPNANEIIFRDGKWPYENSLNTLAFTTVTFDTTDGEILGADIEINSADDQLTTSDTNVVYDLPSILTHELGHAAGLAHSPDPDATMNATYDEGETSLRDLADDDIAAICDVYPASHRAVCDPEPNGGFSEDCASPPDANAGSKCGVNVGQRIAAGASLAALSVLVVGALLRRRRGSPA